MEFCIWLYLKDFWINSLLIPTRRLYFTVDFTCRPDSFTKYYNKGRYGKIQDMI